MFQGPGCGIVHHAGMPSPNTIKTKTTNSGCILLETVYRNANSWKLIIITCIFCDIFLTETRTTLVK